MYTVIGRLTPHTFALLRIVSGLMFVMHGTQKLLGAPPLNMPGMPKTFPIASIPGVAGLLEIVCGALITVGFVTGIAAFLASGEMAVGYFAVHAGKGGFWPIQNKGELAVLYCFVFLYIAAHGAGIWSIDSLLRRRVPPATTTG
jgi:putative oxidoreductase